MSCIGKNTHRRFTIGAIIFYALVLFGVALVGDAKRDMRLANQV